MGFRRQRFNPLFIGALQRDSRKGEGYVPPPGMTFAKSDALFPPDELAAVLRVEFAKQCRALCFGAFPTWDQVQGRLEEIRRLL